ncbi:MAG: phosphatidylglycerophosphatase A [Planctomycetes bacterium]|nr:phosphatidylglycerophosphatase A [Planctomycetota bacterium]
MNRLRLLGMTVFGLGLLPRGKGTLGTLPVAAAWIACAQTGVPVWIAVALALPATLGVIAWGGWAARRFGTEDPPEVVLDEVAGMGVTMLGIGADAGLPAALAGFVLFRLFDIVKPYPIDRMQNLPRGVGIVADDLLAGAFANISLQAFLCAWGRG